MAKIEALVVAENKKVIQAINDDGQIQDLINEVKNKTDELMAGKEFDVEKTADRKELISIAAKVSKTKTTVDGIRRDYVRNTKEQLKLIDGRGRLFCDEMDKLKEEIREPVTAWEDKRKEIDAQIAQIALMQSQVTPEYTSFQVKGMIDGLDIMRESEIVPDKKEEFLLAIDQARESLQLRYEEKLRSERLNEELEEFRQKQAEAEKQAEIERRARELLEQGKETASQKPQEVSERLEASGNMIECPVPSGPQGEAGAAHCERCEALEQLIRDMYATVIESNHSTWASDWHEYKRRMRNLNIS